MKVSIFKNLDNSSRPIKEMGVSEVLEIIKNNPMAGEINEALNHPVNGGKGNLNKTFTDMIWDNHKQCLIPKERNLYSHVKSTKLWAVTWNGHFDEKRRKANIKDTTGYIYCDVDDFSVLINSDKFNPTNIEEAKEYIFKLLTSKSLKFVKAVWKSVSGEGFGFLVKSEGLTVANFKSTWISLSVILKNMGIELDAQTKDITRPNVISSDVNIFIREDDVIIPFVAVEEAQKKTKVFTTTSIPKEIVSDVLQYRLDTLYSDEAYWNMGEGRLTQGFYFNFFTYLNHRHITLDVGMNFLSSKQDEYKAIYGYRDMGAVENIANDVYNGYSHQFGILEVKVPQSDNTVVESIYNYYEGDSELKIKNIINNINIEKYEQNKLIYVIATIVKRTGIQKDILISHLKNIYLLSEEDILSVNKAYGNCNIVFGLKQVVTAEGIAAEKEAFNTYCKENNKKITVRKSYDGDLGKKLAEIYDYANSCFLNIEEEDFFNYLNLFFKKTKAWAIEKSEALDFLYEVIYPVDEDGHISVRKSTYNDELLRYAAFCATEVYNYQPWKFGLNTTDTLSEEQVKGRYNIVQEYTLEEDQYISDLNLDIDDDVIIWGDTGAGKTTWICEHMNTKRLILVPLTTLLEGIDYKHDASVFYKDKKNVQEGDDLIVCTYSSFPKLLNIMERWGDTKISDYELHFDEYHNNAVASNAEFRGYELNSIANNMHLFKKRVWYTGTMFPILHPSFVDLKVIRIKRKYTQVKPFYSVEYGNLLYAVERCLDKEGKNVIYLQNKREEGRLGELLDYLNIKGWDAKDIWCINANSKNTPEFKKLMANEAVDDNVKILICTSVVVEGVNIKNKDFTTVHFMSHEGVVNQQQMVTRLREVFTKKTDAVCNIYLYKKHTNIPVEEQDQIDTVKLQENLILKAQEGLRMFSNAYVSEDSVSTKLAFKLFNQSIFGKSALYKIEDGKWSIDYLAISNLSYAEEKRYSYRDVEFVQLMLKEYNWQYKGKLIIMDDVTSQEKGMLQGAKAFRKEELVEDVQKILVQIREGGEIKAIELLDDDKIEELHLTERPEYEIGLRSKIKFLTNNMEFVDACNLIEEWILIHNMSDRIWSKIVRQINVKVALELDIFKDKYDVTSEFGMSLVKYYKSKLNVPKTKSKKPKKVKLNSKVTLPIRTIVKVIKNRLKFLDNINEEDLTEDIALGLMKQFFDITARLVEGKICYTLTGLKVLNDMHAFNKKMTEWAKVSFESGEVYTSNQLADILNGFRKDLPVLGLYKLTSNQAMRLIHDYYDFARVSEITIKGKRVNTYKIGSLFPLEIQNFSVTPLRKINLMDKHYEDMTTHEKYVFEQQMQVSSLTYHFSMSDDMVLSF